MAAEVVAHCIQHNVSEEIWPIQTAFLKSHAIIDVYKKASARVARVIREAVMLAITTLQKEPREIALRAPTDDASAKQRRRLELMMVP